MVARPAGQDENIFNLRKDCVRFSTKNTRHERLAIAHRLQRIRQGLRLFVNFFLHVVLVLAQLHTVVVQLADLHGTLHCIALRIEYPIVGEIHLDHIALFEIHHVPGDLQQGRHIGPDEVFSLAHSQQQRTAFTRGNELVRIVCCHHADGVGTDQLRQRHLRGYQQAALRIVAMNQVGDDFGVGIGGKFITVCGQVFTQFFVVFDDAVMHHGDEIAADMWMCIAFARHTVRRPSCMCNPQLAISVRTLLFQLGNASRAAHTIKFSIMHHHQTCRVVAAIFQTQQTVYQNRHNIPFSNGTYNPAHIIFFLFATVASRQRSSVCCERESARLRVCLW